MRFRITILILSICLGLPSYSNHAIYLSVVEMQGETISIKVFSDDLQDVIRNYSGETIEASIEEFAIENEEIIESYFQENFLIKINNEKLKLSLEKIKRENDAHFLYFTFANESVWSQVEVQGNFFTELFPDQSNVLTVMKNSEKYFVRLTKENPSYEFIFD